MHYGPLVAKARLRVGAQRFDWYVLDVENKDGFPSLPNPYQSGRPLPNDGWQCVTNDNFSCVFCSSGQDDIVVSIPHCIDDGEGTTIIISKEMSIVEVLDDGRERLTIGRTFIDKVDGYSRSRVVSKDRRKVGIHEVETWTRDGMDGMKGRAETPSAAGTSVQHRVVVVVWGRG